MSIKDLNPATPGSDDPAGQGDDELRALKAAVQAVFPEVEGVITNATGSNPDDGGAWTNPPNAATWSSIFDYITILAGSGSGYVPKGVIMLWSGGVGNIPTNYALCDGTNGTPDLRNRFIVGASDQADVPANGFGVGNSGGNNWQQYGNNANMRVQQDGAGSAEGIVSIGDHVLTEANMPVHEHGIFVPGSGTDTTHPGTGFTGPVAQSHPSSDDRRYVLSEGTGTNFQGKSGPAGQASPVPLSHDDVPITVTGIDHQHDYSPRYYALAYIMYLGTA